MNELIPSFSASLFNGLSGPITDITEFGIDSLLVDGIVKNIPIVSLLNGIKNISQNINNRNL